MANVETRRNEVYILKKRVQHTCNKNTFPIRIGYRTESSSATRVEFPTARLVVLVGIIITLHSILSSDLGARWLHDDSRWWRPWKAMDIGYGRENGRNRGWWISAGGAPQYLSGLEPLGLWVLGMQCEDTLS